MILGPFPNVSSISIRSYLWKDELTFEAFALRSSLLPHSVFLHRRVLTMTRWKTEHKNSACCCHSYSLRSYAHKLPHAVQHQRQQPSDMMQAARECLQHVTWKITVSRKSFHNDRQMHPCHFDRAGILSLASSMSLRVKALSA